jgi:hypothetical protein
VPVNLIVRRHLKRAVTVLVALTAGVGAVNADAQTRVTVSPADQLVVAGNTPTFTVQVDALENSARVIRIVGRNDLRDNYARLTVYRDGKPVELARSISDPGPIGEADIVQLNPQEGMTFVHRGEPYALSQLTPGTYLVKVVVDSRVIGGALVESNTVMLRVKSN